MTQRKNKRKNNKRRSAPRRKGYSSLSTKTVNDLCAVSDPFCKHAKTVAPYGTNSYTIAFQKKTVFNVTTSAYGSSYSLFRASESIYNYHTQSPVSSDFVGISAYDAGLGTYADLVADVRIVSAGLHWHSLLPSTSTGGNLVIIPVADDNQLLDGNNHDFEDLYNSPGTIVTDIRDPGTYVLPVGDKTMARKFKTKVQNGNVITDMGHEAVLLYTEGPASTNVLTFEFVINYEGIIDTTISNMSLGSPQVPRPLAIQYAGEVANGYFQGALQRTQKSMKERAIAYARKWSERFFKAGIEHYLPPANPNTPMIMDVD